MVAAEPQIRSYRLDVAAFEPLQKRRMRRRAAWMVGAVVLGIVVVVQLQPDVVALPSLLPLLFALCVFGLLIGPRLGTSQGKAEWESYQLTLSPNVMRRFVANQPAIEILRPEVTRIVDAPGAGLTVLAGARRFIFIPEQLVGFASLREQLAGWRAFESARGVRTHAAPTAWSLLLVGLWIGSGVIPHFGLAMLAGAALFIVVGYGIRETLRLQVDNRFKARTVGVLGFFLIGPLARAVYHFAFGMDFVWPN